MNRDPGNVPNGHVGKSTFFIGKSSAMSFPAIKEEDRDLETATFHNNYEFVSQWLKRFNSEEKDEDIRRKRCGSLLRRASYCHSVDVVRCIVPTDSRDGEARNTTHAV